MSLFDKNISAEKKASLEFAEDQRETEWKHPRGEKGIHYQYG